ncbi:YggS family pyridoxal phosphate-dependent enzyme [Paracoccus sp. IB05]|uniref:YggS family pyridoxal phosphate-dependent enzyme n=1 Tax=Paracoccus sp. IB05 TaxID=2779367 RepID=UPI0018E7A828|nr:YggS family pyridoxal phosphate-dependent enzyme [Paracoccus sp. IB05]MBJ2153929.1 YggS family pyridoxal phosphate-dependent enzyme [Paracoccus sp. IB05]
MLLRVTSTEKSAMPPVSSPSEMLTDADISRFGNNPAQRFAQNLARVQTRIAEACARAGRAPDEVRLLPVTRPVPAAVLRHAFAAGIRDFGENKLQQARDKQAALSDLPVRWSIIGHLQTNKVRYLVRFASEFHALDSLRLAAELNRRLEADGRDLDMFMQVNTSGEDSKYGLPQDALPAFNERLADFRRLRPQGLMTLAILSADPLRVRRCCATCVTRYNCIIPGSRGFPWA